MPESESYHYKPVSETGLYPRLHPTGRPGHVAIARRDGRSWYESAVAVRDLPDALPALVGADDVYLSTQRFFGRRRIAALAECGALAVDVDYYRDADLRDLHPKAVLDTILVMLEVERKPAPQVAIASGRGLYLLWLHHPIPRKALPRWNACQRELWEVLAPFGADRGALDAARVLRLVGSRHSGAGITVEQITPVGEVWDFDALADEVLEHTRAEIVDLRAVRAARSRSKRLEGVPEGYGKGTLWATRLDDLQRLRDLRWFGQPLPDFRDRWLFLSGVAMSWISPPAKMQRELFALAKEVGGWTEGHARSKMQSVFRTARASARGERVEFCGVEVDPRYRFKSETIVEWLEITPDEEKFMSTLISTDERRRRHRDKERQRQRARGVMSRDEYLEIAAQNRENALRMRKNGATTRQISEALQLSQSRVKQILREGGAKSLPVYGGVAPTVGRPSRGYGGSGEVSDERQDEKRRGDEHPQSCLCDECVPMFEAPRFVKGFRNR